MLVIQCKSNRKIVTFDLGIKLHLARDVAFCLSPDRPLIRAVCLYNGGMDSEYQKGYRAGIEEGKARVQIKYDNLLRQFQNSLIEASQCKRLYESMKERMDMMLNRKFD